MKRNYLQTLVLLVSLLLCFISNTRANETPVVKHNSACTHTPSTSTDVPIFDLDICIKYVVGSVCVKLRCDLHWTDIIQPGLGQLFGHEGCKLAGIASNTTSGDNVDFQGGSEDMIGAIEQSMGVPKGSLKDLLVITSPTFPTPDGEYRVVAKRYPVLKGENGRFLPLEFVAVK